LKPRETPNEGCPLIAGRKLLVADDSLAYRKVIDLTFTDEGMEVTTVPDGQEAWESLEQSVPDVILADVIMPGIGGYELCRLIKQNERFSQIPVMLLVGLYEPFDEAEARRVGADDFVTKPFQSIRQLVSRVGSLLGGKAGDEEAIAHEHSTLGLGHPEVAPDEHAMPETNVTVFVEAPSMPATYSTDPHEAAGSTCAADIDLQTADTRKLERIDCAPPAPVVEEIAYAHVDTIEMEPAIKLEKREDSSADVRSDGQTSATGAPKMNEQPSQQIESTPHGAIFDDAILDLGDFGSTRQRAIAEDVILDLDFEEPTAASVVTASEPVPELAAALEAAAPAEIIAGGPAHEEKPVDVVELQEWSIVTEAPVPVEVVTPVHVVDEGDANLGLSPETIEAIARRTVERLSEKVVREIAWEVVPELAELLIKKKLEEQK
jgi:CheY-like chemotaxis protein